MLRAVIFDMDGLLIDSEPLWVRAEIEVFGSFGVALAESDCALTKGLRVDDVVAFWDVRRGLARGERSDPRIAKRRYVPTRREGHTGSSGVTRAEVEARLVGRVIELIRAEGRGLPGIDVAITAAREDRRRLALASSSPMAIIEAALARLALASAFDVVVSAETEPYGKPHPGIFLTTAGRLDVSPLDCAVLEDSINGVIAAKAARMACIAVPESGTSTPDARFAIADAILPSLADVTPALFERLAR